MTAPDPRLGEIEARYRDCLTYNFGMWSADKLAHEDVAHLLAELRKRDAELEKFVTDIQDALAVPTGKTDAECRGYDQACRDTLTRLRQILGTTT